MTGENDAESNSGSKADSATQTTLDRFADSEKNQERPVLDDGLATERVLGSVKKQSATLDNPLYRYSGVSSAIENIQRSTRLIRSGVLSDVQQAVQSVKRQTSRDLQRVSRTARLTGTMGAVAMSGAVGATAVGVDPALMEVSQTAAEVASTSSELVRVMAGSSALNAARSLQAASTLPVMEIQQLADQTHQVARVVDQIEEMHREGAGSMLAVTSRSNLEQGFRQLESVRGAGEMEVEQVAARSNLVRDGLDVGVRFIDRMNFPSPKEFALFYIAIAESLILPLSLLYPEYRGLVLASPVVKWILLAYIWLRYYR